MWQVTIQCSENSWRVHGADFKAIAAKYPSTLLSSRKMPGDERRVMSYQIEDVNDAEEFTDECLTLDGFMAMFESL